MPSFAISEDRLSDLERSNTKLLFSLQSLTNVYPQLKQELNELFQEQQLVALTLKSIKVKSLLFFIDRKFNASSASSLKLQDQVSQPEIDASSPEIAEITVEPEDPARDAIMKAFLCANEEVVERSRPSGEAISSDHLLDVRTDITLELSHLPSPTDMVALSADVIEKQYETMEVQAPSGSRVSSRPMAREAFYEEEQVSPPTTEQDSKPSDNGEDTFIPFKPRNVLPNLKSETIDAPLSTELPSDIPLPEFIGSRTIYSLSFLMFYKEQFKNWPVDIALPITDVALITPEGLVVRVREKRTAKGNGRREESRGNDSKRGDRREDMSGYIVGNEEYGRSSRREGKGEEASIPAKLKIEVRRTPMSN